MPKCFLIFLFFSLRLVLPLFKRTSRFIKKKKNQSLPWPMRMLMVNNMHILINSTKNCPTIYLISLWKEILRKYQKYQIHFKKWAQVLVICAQFEKQTIDNGSVRCIWILTNTFGIYFINLIIFHIFYLH